MPYYKMAYSIAFVVILSAIQPVVYANEIGQAVERAVSLLAVVFCADTYLVEVQSKRSEVFCLYNLKKQAGVVYKRLFVQVAYLIGISLLAYGLFYWQKPVNLTEELDGGALFGIYCIAIPGTVLFWSVLSVTVSDLVRNRWIGMGVVLLFWFFFLEVFGWLTSSVIPQRSSKESCTPSEYFGRGSISGFSSTGCGFSVGVSTVCAEDTVSNFIAGRSASF